MKVYAKIGSKIKKIDVLSISLIRKKMEGVMSEHKHLCADCVSSRCGTSRGINSPVVYSGIRTLYRDYVFGCDAYKKRKQGNGYEAPKITHNGSPYEPTTYRIGDPDVKRYVMRMR